MRVTRVLYMEDDEDDSRSFARWINRGWETEMPGVPLEINPCDTPEKAVTMLESNVYDIFVADILFDKRDVASGQPLGLTSIPLGLAAISDARHRHKDLAILALSLANGGMEQRAKEAGADEYVSKNFVRSFPLPGVTALGKSLLAALRTHDREPVLAGDIVLSSSKTNHLQLQALVDIIGTKNIANLTVRANQGPCGDIAISFVRAGYSGAAVVRVDFDTAQLPSQPSNHHTVLLKISKENVTLADELRANIDRFPPEAFVPFFKTDRPVQSGQWYAIASDFKIGAETIAEWLTRKRPDADVEKQLQELFLDPGGLTETYRKQDTQHELHPSTAFWNMLTPSRKARILESLEYLEPLAKRHNPDSTIDLANVTRFLEGREAVARLPESKAFDGAAFCWSHGDLHTRNILITPRGPRLIDPGSIKFLPWAADIARLAVDLFVARWDSQSNGQDHEWDLTREWYTATHAFMSGDALSEPETSPNRNLAVALSWIRHHVFSICGVDAASAEWEFRLSLGVEFMRASYRWQDLPTPKRVLGLLAASDALRLARQAWEESNGKR
jgi:CheY-like chemotaxis protein